MGIAKEVKKATIRRAFHYLEKDPEKNAQNLMELVDRFAGGGPDSFPTQRAAFRNVLQNPDNNMYQLIMKVLKETDQDVLKATLENFFFNANLTGWPKQEENRKKYGCNIFFLEVPSLDISSTELREKIRSGKNVKYLIPKETEKYIADHDLYKEGKNNA